MYYLFLPLGDSDDGELEALGAEDLTASSNLPKLEFNKLLLPKKEISLVENWLEQIDQIDYNISSLG